MVHLLWWFVHVCSLFLYCEGWIARDEALLLERTAVEKSTWLMAFDENMEQEQFAEGDWVDLAKAAGGVQRPSNTLATDRANGPNGKPFDNNARLFCQLSRQSG